MFEMGLSYANDLKSHPEWELLTRRSFPASKLNPLQYGNGPITFARATTIRATGLRAGTSLTPCSGYLRPCRKAPRMMDSLFKFKWHLAQPTSGS